MMSSSLYDEGRFFSSARSIKCQSRVLQFIIHYLISNFLTSLEIHAPDTIFLPSARVALPLSRRFFRTQVTCVGALSASSTTKAWPNLTALTKGESS